MPNRRSRIRPAEPHEVALVLLALVTVERRPPPTVREVVRTALTDLLLGAGGAVAAVAVFFLIGWLGWLLTL